MRFQNQLRFEIFNKDFKEAAQDFKELHCPPVEPPLICKLKGRSLRMKAE